MSQTIEPISEKPRPASTRDAWRVAALVAASVTVATIAGTPTLVQFNFLLKNGLHLSANQASTLNIVMQIPAYLRPFIGAGADLFPLFGYHRKSYYALGWILSAFSGIVLGLLNHYTVTSVAALTIVGGFGGALFMVMADAVMVAIGNQTGNVGRYQSLQQFLAFGLGAGLAGVSGILAQSWSYQRCFLVSGLIGILGLPIVWLVPEKRVMFEEPATESEAERAERIAEKQAARERTKKALMDAARTPGLWVIVFYVFYLIITPGTNTAQFYYSTTVLHFTQRFIGVVTAWGYLGSAIGAILFALVSGFLPVRAMVWGAFLMDCSAYPLGLLLHSHLSGIIISFVGGVTGMVYALCLYTLAARACPPGIEGTVYGLVLSVIMLAGALGDKIGSAIYDHFGPVSHHSITHGWYALNWFGFGFTVLAVFFIPFLPAWSKSNEPLRPTGNGAQAAV